MSELVKRARSFAMEVHRGQTRFNRDKTPLAVHLEDVASLVRESGGNDEEVAAAWLHDTIEDTSVVIADIVKRFGESIADIVDGLTDPKDFSGLHTTERKSCQSIRVRSKSDSIKRVKIADQIANIRSVAIDPPVNWNRQKCIDYVEGAMLVASACRGVSQLLDTQFLVVYNDAIIAHTEIC